MGKYKAEDGNYCQMWNKGIEVLNKHNKKITYSTRWLYTHLHLLEHRLTGPKNVDWFFRSYKDLKKDTGMGYREISKGIKTLKGLGLIETWQMHWIDEDKKKSEKHTTAFRILKPI